MHLIAYDLLTTHWRLALAAVVATACLFARVRSGAHTLGAYVAHYAKSISEFSSEKASVVLGPLSRSVDRLLGVDEEPNNLKVLRYYAWCVANGAAILALAIAPYGTLAIIASAVLCVVYAGLILSSFLAVDEDYDIWDGLVPRDKAHFNRAFFIKSPTFVLGTTVLLLLAFAALLTHVNLGTALNGGLLTKSPNAGIFGLWKDYAVHVAATLHALPLGDAVLWLMGVQARPEFVNSLVGKLPQYGIYGAAFLWAFGVYRAIRMQLRDVTYLVEALDIEKEPTTIKFLQLRASRAPTLIKSIIMNRAIHGITDQVKQRYIAVIPHIGLYSYPQTALYNLNRLSPRVQAASIGAIKQLIQQDTAQTFSEKRLSGALNSLRYQMSTDENRFQQAVKQDLEELAVVLAELTLKKSAGKKRAQSALRKALPVKVLLDLATGPSDTRRHDAQHWATRARDLIATLDYHALAIKFLTGADATAEQTAIDRLSYLRVRLGQIPIPNLTAKQKRKLAKSIERIQTKTASPLSQAVRTELARLRDAITAKA